MHSVTKIWGQIADFLSDGFLGNGLVSHDHYMHSSTVIAAALRNQPVRRSSGYYAPL
jgi:hypothetical protein